MVSEGSDQQVVELLSEILRWTKIGALNLKESLAQELRTEQQRLVYELTDGNRSTNEIATLSGIPQRTVAGWWQRWRELGFVDSSPKYQRRVQRLCSLRMLGIPAAELAGADTNDSSQPVQRRRQRKVEAEAVESPSNEE